MKKCIIILCVVLIAEMIIISNIGFACNSESQIKLEDEFKKVKSFYRKYYSKRDIHYLYRAEEKLLTLLENHPDNEEVMWRIAECYSKLGDACDNPLPVYKKGKSFAKKGISSDPQNGMAHYWLGALLGQIGREKGIINSLFLAGKVKEELEKAIKLNPGFAGSYDALARLYMALPGRPISFGDKHKALKYRKKSVKLAPENIEYRWLLYKNYKKLNMLKKASKELKIIANAENEKYNKFVLKAGKLLKQ